MSEKTVTERTLDKIRAEWEAPLRAEIERLAEELRFANAQIMCDNAAISQWRSIWKYLKSENERLRAALVKIRDHKSPHLALRDNARRYIAYLALKGEKR